MITYLRVPQEITLGLNNYVESIVHSFYVGNDMYVMFDVRGLSAGLNFLGSTEITQDRYWKVYGENKPLLEWNASPFLSKGKVQYMISLQETYLFEVLKATGEITKDDYRVFTWEEADGLILQVPEPLIICLENKATLTEKEYFVLKQALQKMKPDILMAYDTALRKIHEVSLSNNHFVL